MITLFRIWTISFLISIYALWKSLSGNNLIIFNYEIFTISNDNCFSFWWCRLWFIINLPRRLFYFTICVSWIFFNKIACFFTFLKMSSLYFSNFPSSTFTSRLLSRFLHFWVLLAWIYLDSLDGLYFTLTGFSFKFILSFVQSYVRTFLLWSTIPFSLFYYQYFFFFSLLTSTRNNRTWRFAPSILSDSYLFWWFNSLRTRSPL